jgi:hypothetical protein
MKPEEYHKELGIDIKAIPDEMTSQEYVDFTEGKSQEKKKKKFRNNPTEVDGVVFDSGFEARYYQILKGLERDGKIHDLDTQPEFDIYPTVRRKGLKKAIQKTKYIADFRFTRTSDSQVVVIEVKGKETAVWRLKKKMFLDQYRHLEFQVVFEKKEAEVYEAEK